MQYASISVAYSGYTSNCPTEKEDGTPSEASLTLSAVEHVVAVVAKALGIPVFHEYSWPDGSCYKVIAAEDITAAAAFLEAAIIEAAPKLTHIGEVKLPAFSITGLTVCALNPDTVRFSWRGDYRTIERIFADRDLPSPADSEKSLMNRKQRRVAAAIERDKHIPRDPKE
jgi:hypothetical protein